ncbi:MAG: hypothetical protein P8L18_13525 [Verrucomicrobiota bacterium]|nr:hypothetical protein [Verrucomicrobiota bacterium]
MDWKKKDMKETGSISKSIMRARMLVIVACLGPLQNTGAEHPGQIDLSPIQNLQYSIDLSTRYLHDSFPNSSGFQSAVGLDAYTKLTGAERDWATIVVQLYGMRLDGHPRPAPFFEGPDDWELMPRINTMNIHLLPDRSLNLKLGHYEIPYGLEVPINSNGTIRQLNHGPNLGIKVDYGVGINGTLEHFQYDLGVSRGAGVEFDLDTDAYILSGRIGTVADRESFYGINSAGLSIFHMEADQGGGNTLRRQRIGLDGQYYMGPFGAMGEFSVGHDSNRLLINSLVELNIVNKKETLLFYLQYRHRSIDRPAAWDEFANVGLGIRWAPDNHWAVSAQVDRTVEHFGVQPESTLAQLQVRYRF